MVHDKILYSHLSAVAVAESHSLTESQMSPEHQARARYYPRVSSPRSISEKVSESFTKTHKSSSRLCISPHLFMNQSQGHRTRRWTRISTPLQEKRQRSRASCLEGASESRDKRLHPDPASASHHSRENVERLDFVSYFRNVMFDVICVPCMDESGSVST